MFASFSANPAKARWSPKPCGLGSTPSSFCSPLHECVNDALLADLVELDGQLVAVDGGDVAIAEFLMEDAVAE